MTTITIWSISSSRDNRALFLSFDAAIGRKITDKAIIFEIAAPATPYVQVEGQRD